MASGEVGHQPCESPDVTTEMFQLSSEQKGPWLFRVSRGLYKLPSYMGIISYYFINHDIRIPIN